MIPSNTILTEELVEETFVGRTYKILISESESDANRIIGFVDDLDAIKQTIFLILSTERYAYLIYSWDYGVELVDLIGQPLSYIMSELPVRISDALLQDNRIESVDNFEFEVHGKKLHTTFTVITTVGEIETELEVDI